MSQSLRTKQAASFLSEHGVQTSQSYLEKCRMRGTDDPRDRGPDYFRDAGGMCWYDTSSLERYAGQRLAERKFRAPAPQPVNFRHSTG